MNNVTDFSSLLKLQRTAAKDEVEDPPSIPIVIPGGALSDQQADVGSAAKSVASTLDGAIAQTAHA